MREREERHNCYGGWRPNLTSNSTHATPRATSPRRGVMDRTLSLCIRPPAATRPLRLSLPMDEFDADEIRHDVDSRLRAHDIRPLRLSRKANVSRPTILRFRKGALGSARTSARLVAACSALAARRVTEAELFGIQSQ